MNNRTKPSIFRRSFTTWHKSIFLMLACCFTLHLQAACPTGNVIYVNVNATGANDGSSWANALTDLRSAISTTCPGITEVWVAAGTYFPTTTGDRAINFRLRNGRAVYGGFNGTETLLSQRNWNTNLTILSGDIGVPGDISDNSFQVIRNYSFQLNPTARLDGFTVTGGNATGASSSAYGGGLFNFQSSPTIANCTFTGNTGTNGGGVANQNSDPVFLNCQFTGNRGTEKGGAMFNETSDPALTNCSFSGNFSLNGGGLYASQNSFPTLNNCTFSGNRASGQGGAIINFTGSSSTVTNCVIWNNQVGASTTAIGASIGNASANASASISYSLIANSGGSGAGWQPTMGTDGGNNLDTDPMLVADGAPDTAPNTIGDLHIQSCSPAIDAGTSTGAPATDLEGNARPALAGYDMGAYEFEGTITERVTCYQDIDGDSFGNPAMPKFFCISCGTGYVANNQDCNDNPATGGTAIKPGAMEICDGKDNDCNGIIDDIAGTTVGSWRNSDVGTANGSANFPPCDAEPGDIFIITASGFSTSSSDKLHSVYQTLCGNGEIIARVLNVQNGGWAGIMLRETLDPGSKKVALKTQLSNNIRREIRSVTNGGANILNLFRPQHTWFRLARNGSNFVGYTSTDGANWSFAFSTTISMTGCIYAGLFSESINASVTTTATFDNAQIIGNTNTLIQTPQTPAAASNLSLEVYPNPTTGEMNIDLSSYVNPVGTVKVFDAYGKLVMQHQLDGSSLFRMKMDGTDGIYFLSVEVEGETRVTKRVVIAH